MVKGSNQDLRNNCECASLHSVALHVDFVLPEDRRRQSEGANGRKIFLKKSGLIDKTSYLVFLDVRVFLGDFRHSLK